MHPVVLLESGSYFVTLQLENKMMSFKHSDKLHCILIVTISVVMYMISKFLLTGIFLSLLHIYCSCMQ